MRAAKFNDFLKEYTDPITGEQKYMEQLVRRCTNFFVDGCEHTTVQIACAWYQAHSLRAG